MHLVSILTLYKKVKESETISKPTASSENLVVQKLIFDAQHSEHNIVAANRSSVRMDNAKPGHALVVRGDNNHDAGGNKIKPTTPSSVENRKKPGVEDLLKASNDSKAGFDTFITTFKDNVLKREERLAAQTKRKLELAKRKVELKEKSNKISYLIQAIPFAKEEIITFQEVPEIKELAVERYKNLYSELKLLTKQTKKFNHSSK